MSKQLQKKVQGEPDPTPAEISGSLDQSKESTKLCCSQEKDFPSLNTLCNNVFL